MLLVLCDECAFIFCDGVARQIEVERDCCIGISVKWIVSCLPVFSRAFAKRAHRCTVPPGSIAARFQLCCMTAGKYYIPSCVTDMVR